MAERIVAADDLTGKRRLTSTTSTTLGYVNGVTSPIQTQLNGKISSTEKGAANGVATLGADGKVPSSQLPTTSISVNSVNGQTGTVVLTTTDVAEGANLYFTTARAQSAITGGASTIVASDLTNDRALISNASGKVIVSPTTSTELGYVNGVTSSIQTQINARISEDLTFLKTNGTRPMTGTLDMGNQSIANILNLTATGNATLSTATITKNISTYGINVPSSTSVTTNGTLTLNAASNSLQFLTGIATGFSVVLPSSVTVSQGQYFEIYNTTTSPVTIKKNSGTVLAVLNANSVIKITAQTTNVVDGDWLTWSLEVQVASGITNYTIAATAAFATSSTTDVQVTGFTLTPMAGTYAIWYNASCTSVSNNSMNYTTLYKDGVAIAGTERVAQSVASNFTFQMTAQGTASFTGAEQLRVYTRVTTGTFTTNARSLVMIRLGG